MNDIYELFQYGKSVRLTKSFHNGRRFVCVSVDEEVGGKILASVQIFVKEGESFTKPMEIAAAIAADQIRCNRRKETLAEVTPAMLRKLADQLESSQAA